MLLDCHAIIRQCGYILTERGEANYSGLLNEQTWVLNFNYRPPEVEADGLSSLQIIQLGIDMPKHLLLRFALEKELELCKLGCCGWDNATLCSSGSPRIAKG